MSQAGAATRLCRWDVCEREPAMNKNFQPFTCAECGGEVDYRAAPNRMYDYAQGYVLPIPDDFLIPTCDSCGEQYFTQAITERLDSILRSAFLAQQTSHYRELVDTLVQRHGVSQRDIVRACGITPSYLSHILAGKRHASTTLTRLLEAFVICSSEFERNVEGRQWSPYDAPLYAVKANNPQMSATNYSWKSSEPKKMAHTWVSKPLDVAAKQTSVEAKQTDSAPKFLEHVA